MVFKQRLFNLLYRVSFLRLLLLSGGLLFLSGCGFSQASSSVSTPSRNIKEKQYEVKPLAQPKLANARSIGDTLSHNPDLLLLLMYANLQYPSGLEIHTIANPDEESLLRQAVKIYDQLAELFPNNYVAAMRAVELGLRIGDRDITLSNATRFVQRASSHSSDIQLEAWYYDLYVGLSFAESTRTAEAYWRLVRPTNYIQQHAQDLIRWLVAQPYALSDKVNLTHRVFELTGEEFWLNVMVSVGRNNIATHLPLFRQVAKSHPDNVALQSAMANYYIENHNLAQSVPYLMNLLNLSSNQITIETEARKLLISYYHQNDVQDYEKSKPHLQWLQKNAKQDANWAKYLYAVVLMQQEHRQPNEALALFLQVDEASPYGVQANYYAAGILMQKERYDEALDRIKKIDKAYQPYELKQANQEIYHSDLRHNISLRLARIYHLKGDNTVALSVLEERHHTYGSNLESVYFQGMLNIFLHRYKVAEAIFRSLIKSHPDNAEVLNTLGYILVDNLNQYDQAKPLLEKANKLSPDQPHILDSLGWLYFHLQQYNRAIELLRQALKLHHDPEILSHLSLALWKNKQQEEASSLIKQGLNDFPNSDKIKQASEQIFP